MRKILMRTKMNEWTKLMIKHDTALLRLSWTLLVLNYAVNGVSIDCPDFKAGGHRKVPKPPKAPGRL